MCPLSPLAVALAAAFLVTPLLGSPVALGQEAGTPPKEEAADADGEGGAADVAAGDVASVVAGLKSKEGDRRLVAATAALEIADDAVTTPLVRLLPDEDFGVRAAAIRALAKRTTSRGKKDAAKALAARIPRLAKSEYGDGELALVAAALGELAQPSSVKPLLSDIDDATSDEAFAARMNAVANIPVAAAIEELIQYLSRQGRGQWAGRRRAITGALQAATGERLGNDPDAWRAWWKENAKTFDFAAAAERRSSESDERERRDERRRDRRGRREGSEGND